jgi:uroporphyrinogen decarboxylase
MNSRERVLAVLNHKKPDRVPIDFGSTVFTTITATAYERLKRYLNIESETKLSHVVFQCAEVEEEILEMFNVDTRGMINKGPEGWIDVITDDGYHIDEWGIKRKMFDNGYLDIMSSPFQDNFSIKAMDNYNWPDGKDKGRVEGMSSKVSRLRKETNYAIILYIFGGITTMSQFLRGYEEWMIDLIDREDLIAELLDRLLKFYMDSTETALKAVNSDVDIVAFADDFADQKGMMFSPIYYRKLIKPRYKKLFDMVKEKSNAKILFHSCGNVSSIIDDLIEIGVDALNPVQVTAEGMDPCYLKNRFGEKITFWGGIDSQDLLPKGSAQEVKKEVKRLIDTLGKDGGYVIDAVHNIQNDVPPENILAMFEAAKEYGRY